MAITTLDGLVAGLSSPGAIWPLFKGAFTPQATGSYVSLWTIAGQPGVGTAPSSGVAGDVPTSATAGAIPFTNNLTSYLGRMHAYSSQAGVLMLYDRLWQNSGLSTTTTTAQTVQASTPTVPLTRPDALGAQVEAWWDIYTVMGAGTPTVFTITYTDQDANTGNTGTLTGFAATAAAGRAFRFTLAAGDTGVRSIQSYTANVSMTSGAMGLVLRRKVTAIGSALGNTGQTLDFAKIGLPRVYDSACLEVLWLASSASSQTVGGDLQIVQG